MAQLKLDRLWAFYGQAPILRGINLRIDTGEILTVLGRNGSGRSTLAKAVMGLVQTEGHREWDGRSLQGLHPHEIARSGIAYVPETRDVFPELTVAQNLALGAMHRARATTAAPPWGVPEVLHLFPQLSQRFQTPAGVLSGGEQQMLALARATLGSPKLLVVDEPTEGLAPQLVKQVSQFLIALKHQGVGVLLMEQKLQMALTISDRIAVMASGAMVFDDSRQAFMRAESQHAAWLAL